MSNEAKTSESVAPKYWFNLAVENFIAQGKSQRTAKTYARDLKILVRYYNKPLNRLTEDEIRKYVVYRQVEYGLHPTTMRILFCGLKFLFREVLGMDYPVFDVMKAQRERRLPDVLPRGEVIKVLNHISTFHCYVSLPEATYELLKLYWKTHKNEKLIFPALGRNF
ncbi:MAG: phage integrase N-terminal SAM-like domain-containing protein [Victivallaceae bacterium]|nr:phage integrase N-terminal SAM-like domain-containing protein [Victivallaceae bacterium]